MRPKIIVFFGPDGSGKTTHIKLLKSYLKNARKIKVQSTYVCSHHLLAWLLFRLFVKLGYYVWKPNKKYPLEKYPSLEPFKGRLSKHIWLLFEFFSLVLISLFKIKIPKSMGYVVIVERYIPGSLSNYVYIFGNSFLNTFFFRFLLRLARDDNILYIYLNADYETIIKRRGLQAESRNYLKVQRKIYQWFAKYYECLVLDTSKLDIKRTQQIIRKYVSTKMQI